MDGPSTPRQRRVQRARDLVICAGDITGPHPLLEHVDVVANDRLITGVGLITLHAPRIAAVVRPGQFVHLRVSRGTDILLRRPFSVHRATGTSVEILYQVLGRGTRALASMRRGDVTDAIGPLGHGWELPEDASRILLVAGGLGAAPLGMLAEEAAARGIAVCVALGAPTASRLMARGLFERVARRVELATDDGSEGAKGFVTVPCGALLTSDRPDAVYVCGPEAMARAVAAQCTEASVPCQVSLERLMGCGVGACLSCVVTTDEGRKRACVDGPVFDASRVAWDAAEIPPRH